MPDQYDYKTIAVVSDSSGISAGMLLFGADGDQVSGTPVPFTIQALTNWLTENGIGTGLDDGDYVDIVVSGSGAVWTIGAHVVTYGKIQNVSATSRVLGRISAGAGTVEELTGTQLTTLLDAFTDVLPGSVPASGGGTDNFLRADGAWATPPTTVTQGVFADLPGSGTIGDRFYITDGDDALTWNDIAAGGGTTALFLVWTGVNWRVANLEPMVIMGMTGQPIGLLLSLTYAT